MFCCKCGKSNPDEATFCCNCGAKLIAPVKPAAEPAKEEAPKAPAAEPAKEEAPKAPAAAIPEMKEITPEAPTAPATEPSPKKKSKAGLVIGIVAGVLVVLIGGGFFAGMKLKSFFDEKKQQLVAEMEDIEEEEIVETPEATPTPEPSPEPTPEVVEEPEIEVSKERPTFIDLNTGLECDMDLVACVEPYTIEEDLSNISNMDQFNLPESATELLVENGFAVSPAPNGDNEFYSKYEMNRYLQKPNFVTVDSMMHTYHLYFAYLLKNTERDYLLDNLKTISQQMYELSYAQYESLIGTQWEEAAAKNVAFFAVAARLQDISISVPQEISLIVDAELEKIMAASGIDTSLITNDYEDYTQYKPRGYYEGDVDMEQYFRAMMWYGRISFRQQNEVDNRSALLMTLALHEGPLELWEKNYTVTSFFAGASDDCGYYEYMPLIQEAYGDDVSLTALIDNTDAFDTYTNLLENLEPPMINSIPLEDGEDNTVSCFRFMGQRFSVDATIFQNLIYSEVGENADGEYRMLPSALDVPAALSSEAAEGLLQEMGAYEFDGYEANMIELQNTISRQSEEFWSASLYSSWMNTLRPLLDTVPEGYPSFMQNEAWQLHSLETFLASYTELKHDTILYSKQVMAEMGGGYEEIDDRGYVEPQPLVYARFILLASQTKEGLAGYGMISDSDMENLDRLAELARQLMIISEKELQNETLTDEEYELIRSFGGNLEHFWYDAMRGLTGEDNVYTADYPCPLVADIATDPNGYVLEVATGKVSTIYVVCPVDGELKLCVGAVYSYYEFPWPMEDRLTDSAWRQMMGLEMDENDEYHYENAIDPPEWTTRYRFQYGN